MRKGIYRIIIAFAVLLSAITQSNAAPGKQESKGWLKELGIFSGYGSGSLKEQDRYELIPIIVQFGFDLKKTLAKAGFRPPGSFNLNVEPFLSFVAGPDKNMEVGCIFMLKYAHPVTKKIRVYLEGGLGPVYITQHTREQSTQFNFADQAGAGFSFLLKDNLALSLGYRFRHISNASIKKPNGGINSDMVLCGVSVLY